MAVHCLMNTRLSRWLRCLLNVRMVVDVILAVAVVPFAPGAVPEFQLRIGNIRPAADRTSVGIGRFLWLGCRLRSLGTEGDDRGTLWLSVFAEQSHELPAPLHGNHIQHILAEEQEVVGKGNNGEQIVGEGVEQKVHQNDHQIQQCKNPGLYRNNEHQQERGVGVHGGIAQEQAGVQVGHAGTAAEQHAVDIHHDNAGEIKQVKAQSAPDILHGPADGVVAEQGNRHQQQIPYPIGQGIGQQPPDLPLENQSSVKVQKTVKKGIAQNVAHDVNHGGAQDDVEHQIGDSLVPVAEAKKVKLFAKFFQESQLLVFIGSILSVLGEKVYSRNVNYPGETEQKHDCAFTSGAAARKGRI